MDTIAQVRLLQTKRNVELRDVANTVDVMMDQHDNAQQLVHQLSTRQAVVGLPDLSREQAVLERRRNRGRPRAINGGRLAHHPLVLARGRLLDGHQRVARPLAGAGRVRLLQQPATAPRAVPARFMLTSP